MVFEDIYICLYKTDGYQSAKLLQAKVTKRLEQGDDLETFFAQDVGRDPTGLASLPTTPEAKNGSSGGL